MISVLIVDDERIIREGLKRLIKNKCPDYAVIGEAADGAQALKLTQQLHPDLAIVDIRMPGLSGIDYMHLAAEEEDPPSFIALTGYAEFEYARKLMGVGCEGYLLKPLKHAELITTLQRIAQKRERCSPGAAQQQGSSAAQALDLLVDGRHATAKALHQVGLEGLIGSYWLMLAAKDGPSDPAGGKKDDSAVGIIQMLQAVTLPGKIKGVFAPLANGTAAAILFASGDSVLLRSQAALAARYLREEIRHFPAYTVSLGLSGPWSGPEAFPTAVEQCLEALAYRFYDGYGQIHFYDAQRLPAARPDINQYERALLTALDINDHRAALLWLSHLLDRLAQDRVEKQDVVMVLSKLYVEIINALEKQEQHALIKDMPEYKRFEATLSSHTLYTDIRREMELIVKYVFQKQEEAKNGSRAVRQARRYIHTHMNQPVTLTDMAREVGMNPSYFSMLFKKETGENFTNYVNRTKIEHAKLLLRQPACKVYQVCSQVGFEDAKYFAKLFRRVVGMTPSDYRDGRSREDK